MLFSQSVSSASMSRVWRSGGGGTIEFMIARRWKLPALAASPLESRGYEQDVAHHSSASHCFSDGCTSQREKVQALAPREARGGGERASRCGSRQAAGAVEAVSHELRRACALAARTPD